MHALTVKEEFCILFFHCHWDETKSVQMCKPLCFQFYSPLCLPSQMFKVFFHVDANIADRSCRVIEIPFIFLRTD